MSRKACLNTIPTRNTTTFVAASGVEKPHVGEHIASVIFTKAGELALLVTSMNDMDTHLNYPGRHRLQ